MKDKRPLESKKFILAALSLIMWSCVWATSLIGCLVFPMSAAHIVTLATLTASLFGGVAVSAIGGQAAIDWRAQSGGVDSMRQS